MRKIGLLVALVVVIAAAPAFADLQYRLNPCDGKDWDHGTQHTVTLQVSTDADVTLYGVEVWLDYYEESGGVGNCDGYLSMTGGQNLVSTAYLESSSSDFNNDDCIANYSQYVFPYGGTPGTGLPLTVGQWVDLAEIYFEVTGYDYHFIIDCNYTYSYEDEFGSEEVAGACIDCDGNEGWAPGEYTGDPTSVELVSFEASAIKNAVNLEWLTASELDNAGFNLYRADAAEGDYMKINSAMIPAEGDAFHGADYLYVDRDVSRGETYYYKLEDVSIHGTSSFNGPVDATVPELVLCGAVSDSGPASLALLALVAGAVVAARRVNRRKKYRKPEVRTTSGDEVLRKLGPAQTCSPTPAQCPTSD